MTIEYDDCLKRGKIKSFSKGKELASKELDLAKEDFETARQSFKDGKYKWATIQIYYSMFHSARALLYAKNLRERSHYCLIEAIKTLYVQQKKIPVFTLEALQRAKMLREEADYYGRWTKEDSEKLLNEAEKFLIKAKEVSLSLNHSHPAC